MLPQFVKSSYERYKGDTNSFATWLLDAGRKCGQAPQLSAVGAGKSKKGGKGSLPESDYQTTIGELRSLSKVVVESAIDVPGQILAIARRAIKLRKDVTSWFMAQEDSSSNKRHAHFISAMEEICETLEWKKKKEPSTKPSSNSSATSQGQDSDIDAWVNRFAALTVEEPEDAVHAPAVSKQIVKVELIEAEERDEEEAHFSHLFFKAYCLFQDLHNIRAFLSQTWVEYRDGKVDLMNASVVTDTALQLARDLIQELVDSWPDVQPDDQVLQRKMYSTACSLRGRNELPSLEDGLPYNKNMSEIADWCYLPTNILLQSFAAVIEPNQIPVYKKGYLGSYDPKEDRQLMSISQRFHEDKVILLELLPEFCVVSMFVVELPVQDEITRAVVEFTQTKKVTIWLSFAVQIFLDMHHAIRNTRIGAFGDLRMSGIRIKKIIEDFWKLSKTHPKPKFWAKEGDEEITRIHSSVKTWTEDDPLLEVRKVAKGIVKHGDQTHEKHFLLSAHPLLCGLTMLHFNLRMQVIGQGLNNQWYDVQQLAFLYNLVNQVPGMSVDWPDMDAFIHIHGESRIFVGSRPKNAAESLARLEMVTGISSATRFARDARARGLFRGAEGKARLLEPTTHVANLFRDRYVCNDYSRNIGIANMEKVLDKMPKGAASGSSRKSNRDLALRTPEQLIQHKWATSHNISFLQLLAILKEALYEEEPVICFSYFGMHKRSIELLRLIRAKEHHKFAQYFTNEYMPDESLISNLVLLIHHVARGSAAASSQLGLAKGAGTQAVSRIVMSCGEVMRSYLQKNGDVALKETRVFCKNKHLQVEDKTKVENKDFAYWFGLEEVVDPKSMTSLMTGISIA